MQKKFTYIFLIIIIFLYACDIKTKLQVEREFPPKDKNCKIDVSKKKDSRLSYQKIAEYYVGDTGLTVNCGYDRMILKVKEKACLVGGDAVLIIDVQEPGSRSTCYRITADIYKTDKKKEIKSSIILGQIGMEVFGYFDGIGLGYDYLIGYENGLKLFSQIDEVQWKIKTSYLKGYVQSKKNEPNIYSKLAGEWISLLEARECNVLKSVSEECLQYKEISPKYFM